MYKKRTKGSKKYNAMRTAKERKRLEGPAPDYPAELPDLRRRVTIEDFDFGYVKEVVELHKTGRIDSYRMIVDGTIIKNGNTERIGWARVLGKIRLAFPRVGSFRGI
ncbi:MAG TPA: hypothetical protein ENH40_05335 [Nitrospirae bacterium]|nr:hypothetical protein [Nitrospirota bacterium]